MSGPPPYEHSQGMTNTIPTKGVTMYPPHTGSVLLDIAHAQRNEVLADARSRRRAALVSQQTHKPTIRPPKRPWWWGLARSRRTA
jgi:hypothetical protein